MSNVAAEIAAVVEERIGRLWQRGWQSADVVRSLDRVLGKGDAVLVRRAIASEAQSYAHLGERVAPDWMTRGEAGWAPNQDRRLEEAQRVSSI